MSRLGMSRLGAWPSDLHRRPPAWLIALAAVGASLLAVIAATSWPAFNDEHAYWLAGQRLAIGEPLYDPFAAPDTPFAYWYPPPMAQVIAPLTHLITAESFSLAWTVLLLACLWWLSGRDVLAALALIAFLPVAVELRVRNVHLVLAVLAVLALRRSALFWIPAAAIKLTPALGAVYLLTAGRWRELGLVVAGGLAVMAASLTASPDAWSQFLDVAGSRAGTDGGSLLPIPFLLRLAVGAGLAAVAGRIPGWRGEAILVVALTVANPTLWATAFSMLVALVPIVRSRRIGADTATEPTPGQPEVSPA